MPASILEKRGSSRFHFRQRFSEFSMNPNYPARVKLAHLPTPLEKMERLSKALDGPEIWIKRDDQTGLAGGGNKTRKLEYLVAAAQEQGSDHLITMGAVQSNHCRQTAAAAAHFGLGCSLVLRGEQPEQITGNILLDRLLGAHLYFSNGRHVAHIVEKVAGELRAMGRTPFVIPYGGSNVVGATAYVHAVEELMTQLEEMQLNLDFIVMASSSGGTQAGLVLGKKVFGLRTQILGISVDHVAESLRAQVGALATATATHIGLGTPSLIDDVEVNDDYVGEGYGILGEPEREAIQMVGSLEGILLDPVYTGRAMAGLIDLVRWGAFTRGQRILFWHTGGMPALFAYGDELVR
jgi:D-cysteine desulfhydrase